MKKILAISTLFFLFGCGTKSLSQDDFDHLEQVSTDLVAQPPEEEALPLRAFSQLCSEAACCVPSCSKALEAVEATSDQSQRKGLMNAGCPDFEKENPGTTEKNFDQRFSSWLGSQYEACLAASESKFSSERIANVRQNMKKLGFGK